MKNYANLVIKPELSRFRGCFKLLTAAALVLASASAPAALYDYSFTDGTNAGNGTLTTDAGGHATSGTLSVTAGLEIGSYSLFSGGPGITTSPFGAFSFDNKVYYGSDPVLDVYGLLFTGSGLELSLWGNAPGNGNYSFWSASAGPTYRVASDTVTFNISPAAVPEPLSMSLIPIGLAALAVVGRRRHFAA